MRVDGIHFLMSNSSIVDNRIRYNIQGKACTYKASSIEQF